MSRGKSGPTSARARCGTTSPTHPMMPEVATLAEVTNVAAATIAIRNGPVASPSARASSSGNDITLSRQRSAISTMVPRATGPARGNRSETVVAARLPSRQNVMARRRVVGSARKFNKPAPAPRRAAEDAGEDEHGDRIARVQQRADDVDGGDRNEPADEGQAFDTDDAEGEIDAKHGAQCRP